MDWQSEAACRSFPIDYFFHDKCEQVSQFIRDLCGACPVRAECLAFAISTDSIGIWAATTTDERKRMRRHIPKVAAHGTNSGYARHRKLGENPCDPCRQARRDYINDLRRRNKVMA